MRSMIFPILVATFTILCGCYDRFYPPTVRNSLDAPARLVIKYEDGQSVSGDLEPGTNLLQRKPGLRLSEISVYVDGQLLYEVSGGELARQASAIDPSEVLWDITPQGIKAVRQAK